MLCEQIAALVRQYIDEPTQDYITQSALSGWLDQAYRDFRSWITTKDQNYLSVVFQYGPVPNTLQIDLKGILLPPAPTQRQMQRLTRVYFQNSGQNFPVILQPCPSLEAFKSQVYQSWVPNYFLDRGTGTLWVSGIIGSNSINIQYIPEPDINWLTAIQPGANVPLTDGLDDWHELIALLACRRYYMLDATSNPMIEKMISEKKQTLSAYLVRGTSNASGFVRHRSTSPW